MSHYIQDTSYAVGEIIDLIYREHRTIDDYQKRCANIREYLKGRCDLFVAAEFDDEGIPGGIQQAYINLVKAKERAEPEIARYENEIRDLEVSIQTKSAVALPALATTILQIAKQGITIVQGELASCPDGRAIGGQRLKNVIWQGRNQAMHYDDPASYRPPMIQCFQQLRQDFGPQFDLHARPGENLALDVIELLGWSEYDAYEHDLRSLLV